MLHRRDHLPPLREARGRAGEGAPLSHSRQRRPLPDPCFAREGIFVCSPDEAAYPVSRELQLESGGAIWEMRDQDTWRFRCHTGRSYTSGSFMSVQTGAVENARRSALHLMEEKQVFLRQMSERLKAHAIRHSPEWPLLKSRSSRERDPVTFSTCKQLKSLDFPNRGMTKLYDSLLK